MSTAGEGHRLPYCPLRQEENAAFLIDRNLVRFRPSLTDKPDKNSYLEIWKVPVRLA